MKISIVILQLIKNIILKLVLSSCNIFVLPYLILYNLLFL